MKYKYKVENEEHISLVERCKTYLQNFVFFETHSVKLESDTYNQKLEKFILLIDTFEEDDFSIKVSHFFESSFTYKRLKQQKISYIEYLNYYYFRFMYAGRKSRSIPFKYKPYVKFRRDPIIQPYIDKLFDFMRRLHKEVIRRKIIFFKGIYYYPDDTTGIRNLSANILELEVYPRVVYMDNQMLIRNTYLYFHYFKLKMIEYFEDLVIFGNFFRRAFLMLKRFKMKLHPLYSQFWSLFKNYANDWNYYSRLPVYEKIKIKEEQLEKSEMFDAKNIIDYFQSRPTKKRKIKTPSVKFNFKSLRKYSFVYRPVERPKKNVYCFIIDPRGKNRFRKKSVTTTRVKLFMKIPKTHAKKRKIKTLSARPNGYARRAKYFSKNLKIFREFLNSQNLGTAEKEETFNDSFYFISQSRLLPRKSFKRSRQDIFSKADKLVLNSNFLFSAGLTSLNAHRLPNLEVFSESKFLFDLDSASGQSHNLRSLTNPDLFWDEWDTAFVRQQNGLQQSLEPYEDDYLGEDRFFSPAIPADHTDDPIATKDDSNDLIVQEDTFLKWRFNPDRNREPHRKFRFRPFSVDRSLVLNYFYPPDNYELSKDYREYPDWEVVPGLQNYDESQEEIIVGDGPTNYIPMSQENAETIFGPEFDLSRHISDPFDSTILYDWYTLQRMQSAFSERHPNDLDVKNRFKDYFSVPYASSILNCEDYFFRELYKSTKRAIVGRGIEKLDLDHEHFFWDIKIELPELHWEYNSKEALGKTNDLFIDTTLLNTFGFFSKGFWRDRLPRNPILKFSNTLFENLKKDSDGDNMEFDYNGIKQSRAFFYNERSLNKKFNKTAGLQNVQTFYWFTEFLVCFMLLFLTIHLLFKHLKSDDLAIMLSSRPYFQFWDTSGLPSMSRQGHLPLYSNYGGLFHEKIKILKKVYLKYTQPTQYKYDIMMKRRSNKNYVPENYFNSFFKWFRRKDLLSEESDVELQRTVFGKIERPYHEINRFYFGQSKRGSRTKGFKARRVYLLYSGGTLLKPNLYNIYTKGSSLPRDVYQNVAVVQPYLQRFKLNNVFLRDLLLKNTSERVDKFYLKFSRIRPFSLNSKVSGFYGMDSQYMLHEHPYSTDVAAHSFISRTNRIFNNKTPVTDRYFKEWRLYDIFFARSYLNINYDNIRPPVTSLIHEQNLVTRAVRVRDELKKHALRLMIMDTPGFWNVEHPSVSNKYYKYLRPVYRLWNGFTDLYYYKDILKDNDDFLFGVSFGRHYYSKRRSPNTYFKFDTLEQVMSSPRFKTPILPHDPEEPRRLLKLKKIFWYDEDRDGYYRMKPTIRYKRSSVPVFHDKLFSQVSSSSPSTAFNPVPRLQKVNYWLPRYVNKYVFEISHKRVNYKYLELKGNYSLRDFSITKPYPQYDIDVLRRPLYSTRNRNFKHFKSVYKKRLLSTLIPFGVNPFSAASIIGTDQQPIFQKKAFPYMSVSDVLSLTDLNDLESLKFFLLLDNMSNKFQSSSSFNAAHGFKSYWFSKVSIDPTTKSHRALLHVGSNYQLSFMLNIPSLWESSYNSLWVKNLTQFNRTNFNLVDKNRDYSYGQDSYIFYFISFVQGLVIQQTNLLFQYLIQNSIFFRNLFFILGLLYICIPHYSVLKYQYLRSKKVLSFGTVSFDNLLNKNLDFKPKPNKSRRINSTLFKNLKKFKSLHKQVVKLSTPELYNSGGKRMYKQFLKRPSSFKNHLYTKTTNNLNRFGIPIKLRKKIIIDARASTSAITNYSFLWSVHEIDAPGEAKVGRKRELSYRARTKKMFKNFNYSYYLRNQYKDRAQNQNLFFERRQLPYRKGPQSVMQGYIFYNTNEVAQKTNLNSKDSRFNLEFYAPEFYDFDEFTFRKNDYLNDNYALKYNEKTTMTDIPPNTHYSSVDPFNQRRRVWSSLRAIDRINNTKFKKETISELDLEIYGKQLNRRLYERELSALTNPQNLISGSSLQDKAINDLLSFNTGFLDLNHPYSAELNNRANEEIGPLLDLDEDDSDERVEDSLDHEIEPVDDVLPLNPESDDTEDHFESIFIELIHKMSSPESSVEVSLNSLLCGETSRTFLKRSVMTPNVLSSTYCLQSELVNYKRWRLQSVDYYKLEIPALEISLPTKDFDIPDEQIAHKIYFNPSNFGMPTAYTAQFLVSYSLPRFLKRLTSLAEDRSKRSLDFSYTFNTSKYYDPSDPEGFDIKPFKWLAGVYDERPYRLASPNNYQRHKGDSSHFSFNKSLGSLPSEREDLNVGNSFISQDTTELVTQMLDPLSGDLKYSSAALLLAEDFFSSSIEEVLDNNSLKYDELSHSLYSYNLEEEDEAVQLFETKHHYKWRFLSREYLLNLLNRPSEFAYTQLEPFSTATDSALPHTFISSENFNFSNFLLPLDLYYSEFGEDKDLVNDFIAHWPEQIDPISEDLVIDAIIAELDFEGDDMPAAIFDQPLGDEDADLVEDDEDILQSMNFVIIQDEDLEHFELGLDLLLRDVDISDFSVENEDFRQDSALRASAVSMFLAKDTGFATFPTTDVYDEDIRVDFKRFRGPLKLTTIKKDKKSTEDPAFPFTDLDLAELLIPMSQNKITRVLENNDQVVVADTMDRVMGYLSPAVVKRGTADLLHFRKEVVEKNLDLSLVENALSTTVSNKELLNFLFLIQSPELNIAVAKVKLGVTHELEQASLEDLNELDEYYERLNILYLMDKWRHMHYDFEKYRTTFRRKNYRSDLFEREFLRNDLIHHLDSYYNLLIRDTNSLKFCVLTNLYFKTGELAHVDGQA